MIALFPLILLWVRFSKFRKLTLADLPLATEEDLKQMRKFSGMSVVAIILFGGLSIIPIGTMPMSRQDDAMTYCWIITIVGVVLAAALDFKAEGIKKRCLIK